jgi:hypothetical protein
MQKHDEYDGWSDYLIKEAPLISEKEREVLNEINLATEMENSNLETEAMGKSIGWQSANKTLNKYVRRREDPIEDIYSDERISLETIACQNSRQSSCQASSKNGPNLGAIKLR